MSIETLQWTPEQKAAIQMPGNLLVSAAAGSGKTAVLAERCAYLVCDAEPPCDVDQLLVVTFTETTAAEMKGRIEAALRKRLDADPHNNRLRTQLAQIDRAQVSTLHAFCLRLLRQHFHLLELDPNFTTLDADEARLLRTEIVQDLFADSYETDESGQFQKLIDIHGDGKDEALQGHVLRTYELLCSVMDPDAWLTQARARIDEGATKPLRACALGRELAAIVTRRLSSLADRCDAAIETVRRCTGFAKYVDYLENLSGEIEKWAMALGDGDFDALSAAVGAFQPDRKPSIKNDTPGKAIAFAALESICDEMGDKGPLRTLIRFSSQEWSDGLKTIQPSAQVFLGLVDQFRRRYTAAKQRIRAVDFSDLERLALKLLRTNENGQWLPSPVARACHRQIAYVLVDEYQDINGVQDEILRLVSRECHAHGHPPHPNPLPRSTGGEGTSGPNLFCVGDVKQSIYGFRLAEPARFLGRYERFKSAPGSGKVIDLQANFRSRAPLLEALNGLFERLLTREAADINYDESQKLRPGATYPDFPGKDCFTGAPIELHLLPKTIETSKETGEEETEDAGNDLDRTEREASFIGRRIHQLMGDDGSPPMHVIDRGPDGLTCARPIAYRDIVILLRSMVYKAEQIAGVLRQHGIPVHHDSGSGFFNSTEIRDMICLLRVLDNARQDIPLAAVLRSPLCGLALPEDSLARVRLAYRDAAEPVSFSDAVVRYATEQTDELAARLRDFLGVLHRWRTTSRLRPVADLIRRIYEDTGYIAFCSGLENGEQRCANLMYLHERARQFGAFSRQGLYRFLRFLDRLENESDVGLPSVLGQAENVVRVRSVHRAKGLEFPVVFLADLGKRFNLADSTGRVLVDRACYLGLSAVDEAKQVRYPSLASVLVSQRLRQQMLAEELRILYVAATRAKEHLILVGACDAKSPARWQALYGALPGALPAETVLAAGNALEWIGPAAAALEGSGKHAFSIAVHSMEEVNDWNVAAGAATALSPQQASYAALKPLDPPPPKNDLAQGVIERLNYEYPHASFAKLRAALPVTEWAKRKTESTEAKDVEQPRQSSVLTSQSFLLPRAIVGEMEMAPTEKGTATHLVLQHLDFTRPCRAGDLRDQIDWMIHRKLITKSQADVVNHEAIAWFAGCEIGQLIRRCPPGDVIREIPFNMALPEGPIAAAAGLDQVMLRGRIDLLVRQGNSCIVIDYKTDDITAEQLAQRKQSYGGQVTLYRDAIQKLTGLKVAGIYLIFLAPRLVCEMGQLARG